MSKPGETATRTEKDSMGEMQVPAEALYGASTQRAVLNFPISGIRFSRRFIGALGLIKRSAARVTMGLGMLPPDKAAAIMQAAGEVYDGSLDDHFVLDIFQTGSGTSTNMNANEVIANRAIEILGGQRGDKQLIHANDHVNMCQSSNDVIPTALHIAADLAVDEDLTPALQELHEALAQKAAQFSTVLKAGRTHLQDATPIMLGQEFSGYAAQVQHALARLERAQTSLRELALGGTAVGTGMNTHPEFAAKTIAEINQLCGGEFIEAQNHFEAQGAQDAAVELSGQLKTIACSLFKIANDVRWLAAGPRCSLAELKLPEVQPGSSIMPAKVNPVICESLMMVCIQVMGNDTCVMLGGQHGNFDLNVMLPVMAHNLLQSIELLAAASRNFARRCVSGIQADEARCLKYAESSLAACTALAPIIGYDKAAAAAKLALERGLSVREAVLEKGWMTPEEASRALDLAAMTKPGLENKVTVQLRNTSASTALRNDMPLCKRTSRQRGNDGAT